MSRPIGILGGTGPQGTGLGLRWARAGERVVIGSRDASGQLLARVHWCAPDGRRLLAWYQKLREAGKVLAGSVKLLA